MTANVYVYHWRQPGIPQLSAAGATGELETLLDVFRTGFGAVTLDSLTQTGGIATASKSTGLNLADGLPALSNGAPAIPIIIQISGSTNGWDGEYTLNALPSANACTFACNPALPSPATGTITLKRAPCGLAKIASAANKSVWQFRNTVAWPGFLILDDSNAQYGAVRLAESAASPADYSTMAGLCPTAIQIANPGLIWRKTNTGGGNRPFVAVAWECGIYLMIAWANASTLYDPGYAGACITRRAGDAYHGIIIGNTIVPSSVGSNHSFDRKDGINQNGHYLQRKYDQIGSALQFVKTGTTFGSNIGGGSGPPSTNPTDNGVHCNRPIYISEGTTNNGTALRGCMPLLLDPLNGSDLQTLDVLENVPKPGRNALIVRCGASSILRLFGFDITGPAEWPS